MKGSYCGISMTVEAKRTDNEWYQKTQLKHYFFTFSGIWRKRKTVLEIKREDT